MSSTQTLDDLYSLFLASTGVCTDSRKPLEGGIFFALKGANFDGNAYALKALEKGCKYAVVDDPALVLRDSRMLYFAQGGQRTLEQLAHLHRKTLGIPVLGITGTNGKTTTKELIGAVLAQSYRVLVTEGNLNNQIGVPLTLLKLKPEHQLAVIEMGANHPNDIAELAELAAPDYGLITNIGKAHLGGFKSLEGVKQAKGALYEYIKRHGEAIFLSQSDPTLQDMARDIPAITYGTSTSAQIVGTLLPQSTKGTLQFAWYQQKYEGQEYHCNTHLVGNYNFSNALAAIAVGRFFSVPMTQINEVLQQYTPDNNRSQLIENTPRGNTVVADAYNANPSSMAAAIENLLSMPLANHLQGRLLILGDMMELGDYTEQEHKRLIDRLLLGMEKLPQQQNMRAYLCGTHFGALKKTYQHESSLAFFDSTERLAQHLEEHPPHKQLILLKGSNSLHLPSLLPLC